MSTRALWVVGGVVAAATFAAAGAFVTARRASPEPPTYHQITFRRGSVQNARFAPDGETILYSANWDGQPMRLFSARINNAEAFALPFDKTTLLAVSSTGQMAIRLSEGAVTPGTLAVVPITGTQTPRELVTDAIEADWSPRGETLVVTHQVNGRFRLESPPGKVLYDSGQAVLSPHFSPKGDSIAFIEISRNPGGVGRGARIALTDLAGHVRVISEGWGEAFSLSWSPDGSEIWFSAREAASESGGLALHAVTLSGRHRVIARMPGILFLRQVWSDGRVLLEHADWPVTMLCQAAGTANERNLSWLDFSLVKDISAEGRVVVFDEAGIAGGSRGATYVRKLDGSAAVRLDEGQALALSPDGGSVLTFLPDAPDQLRIVPTGPGQTRIVRAQGMVYVAARWFPDREHLLIAAREPGHTPSLFVQGIDGGTPRRILDDASNGAVSPDGRTVATIARAGVVTLTPVDGGQPRVVHGIPLGASLLRWADTNRYLFLQADDLFPARILRFDLETGRTEPWLTLGPPDMAGVKINNGYMALSADGRSYCYSYVRFLSTLFVVEGLK